MCVLSFCAMGSGIKMYVLLLFVICVGDWEKQREVAFSLTEKSSIKVKIGSYFGISGSPINYLSHPKTIF